MALAIKAGRRPLSIWLAACLRQSRSLTTSEISHQDPQVSIDLKDDANHSVSTSSTSRKEKKKRVVDEGEKFRPFSLPSDSSHKEGSFQHLFENSQLVKSVDPVGKTVEALVVAFCNDMMYVDFGCKFHAVVKPPLQTEHLHVGAKVRVVVDSLEATSQFVGDNRQNTLLESHATYLGIIHE